MKTQCLSIIMGGVAALLLSGCAEAGLNTPV